jgi:Domain of unknown function (DUF222)
MSVLLCRIRRMGESDQVVIDGITVELVDPALCTPMPTSSDVLHRPDSVAQAACVLPPSGELLTAVQSLLPGRLSDAGLIDALEACDRLRALVEAKQAELLAELAGRDPDGEKFLRDEAALALKLAPATTHGRLAVAEALTSRLWDTYGLLRDGHLPYVHARILADATDDLPDEIVAKVQAQVLKRAPGQTPGEFRAAVHRAIARHDAKTQAEKHRDAARQRHVRKGTCRGRDGLDQPVRPGRRHRNRLDRRHRLVHQDQPAGSTDRGPAQG